LGADDKNGIWIALRCLQKYDSLKCAFFVQEEVGCRGSSRADMSFFNDARFVLQCDRKGGNDLIWNIGGYTELCSNEFLSAIGYQEFSYKLELGMMTDVESLKDNGLKVSCLNLSCGYYRPHTDEEYTKKSELLNCLKLVEHIIETCPAVYQHENISGYGYGRYMMDDTEEDLYEWICDYMFNFPDATFEDVLDEFDGYGLTRDQIELAYEDIRSMYF
jgi:putative aminopeptidase FrvX